MNNLFQNMNYPQHFNRQNIHTNALRPPQKARQNQSQKRQTPQPFITQLPYHLPGPIQQHQSLPNGYMRGQEPFHPQVPSNQIFDYVEKLQTVVGHMQYTCKEMYEWILRYHLALEQQKLQKNYLRNLLQESCVERTKIIQAYQNLYHLSLNNQQKNKNQPAVPENIPTLKNKIQNKEEKKMDISLQKSNEKQIKPQKSLQKKNISEQKPRKKQVQNTQKQKIKKPIIQKEQSEEKKVFSNQDQSVKKQTDQYKYYNKTFQSRGELKQYKKKLRDRYSKDLTQQIIPAKNKRARKTFQYVQLDNAPKALKKLRQEYMAKKSQYLKEKHKNEIQKDEQNNSNQEKKCPQIKQKFQQDYKIKQQNRDLQKKNIDHKNCQKKNKNLNKQFLSDGLESDSFKNKEKQKRAHNSILKPLFQTNKKQAQDQQKIKQHNHIQKKNQKQIENSNQIHCEKYNQNEESKNEEKQRVQDSIESNSESQRKEQQQVEKNDQIQQDLVEKFSHLSDQNNIQAPIKIIQDKVHYEDKKLQNQKIQANKKEDIQIPLELKDNSQVFKHQQDYQPHYHKNQDHNQIQSFKIKNMQQSNSNSKQSQRNKSQNQNQIQNVEQNIKVTQNQNQNQSQNQNQNQSQQFIHPDIIQQAIIQTNPAQKQQNQPTQNQPTQNQPTQNQPKPIITQPRRIKIIKRQTQSSSSSPSSSSSQESQKQSSYGSPSHYQDELINSYIYDQILQKRNIVHYDIEQTEHKQKKQKKKKIIKVKIPCFKNQPFLIIKNYRQYQKLNNYGVTFQGVFQNQKITRNNFEQEKYDQVFSYKLSKQKRKERKLRGKYKKSKQIKQEGNIQEHPDSQISNSESMEHQLSQSEDHGVKYTQGSYKL